MWYPGHATQASAVRGIEPATVHLDKPQGIEREQLGNNTMVADVVNLLPICDYRMLPSLLQLVKDPVALATVPQDFSRHMTIARDEAT